MKIKIRVYNLLKIIHNTNCTSCPARHECYAFKGCMLDEFIQFLQKHETEEIVIYENKNSQT